MGQPHDRLTDELTDWERRVRDLEAQGCCRSDAQALVDAEDAKAARDGSQPHPRADRVATGPLGGSTGYFWDSLDDRYDLLAAMRYGRWDGKTDDVEVRR